MFTGLIQAVGTIAELSPSALVLACDDAWPADPLALGESIAVNGCCLTVVAFGDGQLKFDLSEETWRRTAFSSKRTGDLVNVERAMKASDRFGGHIVQGHVDRLATLIAVQEQDGDFVTLTVEAGASSDRYLIDKGSVALDGISLTVVNPAAGKFEVAVIPHTLEHTSIKAAKVGDAMNVEFDVLAKHVEKLLSSRS